MKIQDHHLVGDGVVQAPSPNFSGPFDGAGPDTIILHYTAGASAASAVRTLRDPQRKVSAHLVVGRDGVVTQLLPFDTIGWHAGRSAWGDRDQFNQFSIGIEIDNAGRLHEREGRLLTWFERAMPKTEAVQAVHRNDIQMSWWHRYPDDQLQVVEELCHLLGRTYPLRYILGHEEIAPQRKIDPGPAFPLDALRARVLGARLARVDEAARAAGAASQDNDIAPSET